MDSESKSSDRANGDTNDPNPGRDGGELRREKFDWSRVLGSVPTAIALIVVAGVGATINSTISEEQRETQRQIASAENFAQAIALQASREAAQGTLRANVVGVLAEHVVSAIKDPDFKKVALLAAFHGNFSESIDTRPVFEALLTEITKPAPRYELRRLAKRVARRQADYIVAHGGTRCEQTLRWSPGSEEEFIFNFVGHTKMRVAIQELFINTIDDTPIMEDVANYVDVQVIIDEHKPRFEVTYLDVPYIDNMLFVHSNGVVHRTALLLLDITEAKDGGYDITMEALHFAAGSILPGDTPSIQMIRRNAEAPDSDEGQEDHHEHSGS